ncbi:hypothetical protein HOY80DRAFT_1061594 [Tuber brumale]|nr:hypothetical protein HOY80DRAFT_1061594 [Tuber brumale]
MGLRKSHSSVDGSLVTETLLQQAQEKSSELKVKSKITAAFCPFCSDNHHQLDCELWMEKVVEEERRLEKVECAGGVDVKPLVIEEEVAVVAEKTFVVSLAVAVAESVVGAEVAEDVAMVEVA